MSCCSHSSEQLADGLHPVGYVNYTTLQPPFIYDSWTTVDPAGQQYCDLTNICMQKEDSVHKRSPVRALCRLEHTSHAVICFNCSQPDVTLVPCCLEGCGQGGLMCKSDHKLKTKTLVLKLLALLRCPTS